jgi:hypothetical protein
MRSRTALKERAAEKVSAIGSSVFASKLRTAAVQLGGRRAARAARRVVGGVRASANTKKESGMIALKLCTRCSPATAHTGARTHSERMHEQGELYSCCVGVRAAGWLCGVGWNAA